MIDNNQSGQAPSPRPQINNLAEAIARIIELELELAHYKRLLALTSSAAVG